MIHLLVLAAALMAPTVDPIETRLAARDAANDEAWRTLPDAAAFKAKQAAFKKEFRRADTACPRFIARRPCVSS